MCGQFADLMEHVNGTNTYEVLLALSMGVRPPSAPPGAGRSAASTSFVLRHFRDALVAKAPGAVEVAAVLAEREVSVLQSYYNTGQRLSESDYQFDGYSYRYAVVNMFGDDRASLTEAFEGARETLAYELIE